MTEQEREIFAVDRTVAVDIAGQTNTPIDQAVTVLVESIATCNFNRIDYVVVVAVDDRSVIDL